MSPAQKGGKVMTWMVENGRHLATWTVQAGERSLTLPAQPGPHMVTLMVDNGRHLVLATWTAQAGERSLTSMVDNGRHLVLATWTAQAGERSLTSSMVTLMVDNGRHLVLATWTAQAGERSLTSPAQMGGHPSTPMDLLPTFQYQENSVEKRPNPASTSVQITLVSLLQYYCPCDCYAVGGLLLSSGVWMYVWTDVCHIRCCVKMAEPIVEIISPSGSPPPPL